MSPVVRVVAAGAARPVAAPETAVLDVVTDHAGRLRAWWRAEGARVEGVVAREGAEPEQVSAPADEWLRELARCVPAADLAGRRLPDAVVLPVEVLAGSVAAYRRGRGDLVDPLAASHGTDPAALPLLHALAGHCRGRLRLLVARRGVDDPVAVTSWVLLADGWRALRPAGRARVRVERRRSTDLGVA